MSPVVYRSRAFTAVHRSRAETREINGRFNEGEAMLIADPWNRAS